MKNIDEDVKKSLMDRYELLKKEVPFISNDDDKHEILKEMKNISVLVYQKFGIDLK